MYLLSCMHKIINDLVPKVHIGATPPDYLTPFLSMSINLSQFLDY